MEISKLSWPDILEFLSLHQEDKSLRKGTRGWKKKKKLFTLHFIKGLMETFSPLIERPTTKYFFISLTITQPHI